MLSKKEHSIARLKKHDAILNCPICHTSFSITEQLTCTQGHSFDFSKQGYLNLLNQHNATHYDKALFESRRELITESVFFTPLIERITSLITEHLDNPISIVDGGCGEGSHLAAIVAALKKQVSIAFGTDIAKEGILSAAKHYTDVTWIVADLANMPFSDKSINVILNILSPANYKEFDRMLSSNGLVLKVVPQSNYLQELRHYFYADSAKKTYTNDDTVALFAGQFPAFIREPLTYKAQLSTEQLSHLLHMTPLTWNLTEDELQTFITTSDGCITADFDILIGHK